MVEIPVDELEFEVFMDWVKATDWMVKNIPEDKIPEEGLKRAIAATMKLLLVNPDSVMYRINEETVKLQKLLRRVDGEESVEDIISQALTVSSLLMLFSALKEIKDGAHGGDVVESIAFSIRGEIKLYRNGMSDFEDLKNGLSEQAGRIIHVFGKPVGGED